MHGLHIMCTWPSKSKQEIGSTIFFFRLLILNRFLRRFRIFEAVIAVIELFWAPGRPKSARAASKYSTQNFKRENERKIMGFELRKHLLTFSPYKILYKLKKTSCKMVKYIMIYDHLCACRARSGPLGRLSRSENLKNEKKIFGFKL